MQEPDATITCPGAEGPSPPTVLLTPGTVVANRFVIEECLGVGGFAIVYRAADRHLGRMVAIKVLRAFADDRRLLALRREVAIARDVACPQLVRVFDFVADAATAFLTMELVEGGTLRAELARGPLPVARAVELTMELLVGLAALHERGIVHRDVKPGNVLLDARGHAKLADFGLARALVPDGMTRPTQESAIVGTVEYLAPEQFRGLPLDARSDLYSLGVLLFEMLSGRLPHPSGTRLEAVIGHLQRTAPDVRTFRPEIPRWLAAFVARLLEKDPARRYPSAGEALARLRSRRTGIARAWWRRNRRAALLAAGLTVLAASAAAWYLTSRPRFSHLIAEEGRGVAAIDEQGSVLWRLASVSPEIDERAALVRIDTGARKVVALFPFSLDELPSRAARTLAFLDPETGKRLREIEFAAEDVPFEDVSPRFVPGVVNATDVDGDGVDEAFVTFNHMLEAPSFVVMFEPAARRATVVFSALGYYYPVGVHSLDGEPVLLLVGINNGLGWVNAMAAIRLTLRTAVAGGREAPGRAFSPELARDPRLTPSTLLWYALLPPGRIASHLGFDGKVVEYDDEAKTLKVKYEDGRHEALRFDGSPLSLPPDPSGRRGAARDEAYGALREGERLRAAGAPSEAVETLTKAVAAARRSEDFRLEEAAERWLGRALVAAGRSSEADALFSASFSRAESPANVAWDAARAFHIEGDLERAAQWYERGVRFDAGPLSGRQKHYYLMGLVMALGEAGDWNAARRAVASYASASGVPEAAQLIEQYVNWRAGWPVDGSTLEPMRPNIPDLMSSWHLEIRREAGDPPGPLLAAVEALLAHADEAKGQLQSLRGELLAALGRQQAAAAAFRQSIAALTIAEATDVAARFDRKLVEARLKKLLETSPAGEPSPSLAR